MDAAYRDENELNDRNVDHDSLSSYGTFPVLHGNACSQLITDECLQLAVCHECRLGTTVHNCTRDGGGPFEVGNQVLISSHGKLLSSKAMVVSVAETAGHDPVRQG
jgi:hypothetical protein